LSPVGLSVTTKLAPKAYVGQMMGIWFVGASVGNLIAGLFAGGFDSEDVTQLPDLFMSVVLLGVGAGLTFIAISGVLRKWMGDVK
jgi:POT family proton-dependent oligopeptide transporter